MGYVGVKSGTIKSYQNAWPSWSYSNFHGVIYDPEAVYPRISSYAVTVFFKMLSD